MNAVDEYRSWCREHVRESPGFDLADAAIAELEAERGAAVHMVKVGADAYVKLKAEAGMGKR